MNWIDHSLALLTKRDNLLKLAQNYEQSLNFSRACALIQRAQKFQSQNLELQAAMARNLGRKNFDFLSKSLSDDQINSINILNELLIRMKLLSLGTRLQVRHDYYFFSKQYKKLFILGKSESRKNNEKAYLSQAIGATLYGRELSETSKFKIARQWLCTAQLAWDKYFQLFPNDKDPLNHFLFSLCLGLVGEHEAHLLALKKCSELSGKREDYFQKQMNLLLSELSISI